MSYRTVLEKQIDDYLGEADARIATIRLRSGHTVVGAVMAVEHGVVWVAEVNEGLTIRNARPSHYYYHDDSPLALGDIVHLRFGPKV